MRFFLKHWEWFASGFSVLCVIGWSLVFTFDVKEGIQDRYTAADAAADRAFIQKEVEILREQVIGKPKPAPK